MSNYELYHYGVKGMKWGVRKKRWSEDAKTASSIRKKKVKEMSNAELRKLNERTRLEKEYGNLNPGAVSRGLKFVGATVATMGTVLALHNNGKQIINLGRTAGSKIVDMAGDRIMSELAKNL